MKGKKGDLDSITGMIKNEAKQYLLTYLLSKCTDFTEQKTDINQLCDELSFNYLSKYSILFTPKYHCKLTGEGIE